MSEPRAFVVRRVLVALSAATASRAAIAGAVDLAARLGAEVEVLFIEDESLLGLSDLPFVRQFGLHGASGRPLARADIELELRALAAEMRAGLAEAAATRGVSWSFRTVRGRGATDIAAAAAQADLLVLGARSRPLGRAIMLEVSLPSLVAKATRPVLLLQQLEGPLGGPVHVLIETEPDLERSLHAAAEIARRYDQPLVVRTSASGEGFLPLLEAAIASLSPPATLRRHLASPAADLLETLLGGMGGGTLVLDAESPLLKRERAWQRLARASCAFLLVR